jgi:hypothetical protein
MEISHIIHDLTEELDRVNRIIALLEEMEGDNKESPFLASRRGRKSMGAPERREVSERMKRYWAERRRQRVASANGHAATLHAAGA